MSTNPRFDGPGPDQVWRQALADGRFVLQRCKVCDACRFPPALVCAACGSDELEWRDALGRGTVYSTTAIHDREGIRNVALIDLAEGARMMSRVEAKPAQAVRIGMSVAARIVHDPAPTIVFDPVEGDEP